ncbi:DNA repair protein RadA [Flavipsychrobacter stenotrophus]|uniref:DNA repair protein RadA n=1 Tax=Flavipsychrobacter stenotrophus TaxID=2077091 RepID=A0A2S7SZP3_9BACT|nr:DNA repair protein RadA [Flavipsychrobacter stenotrophus]PQJ11986.1 DNA repair protein RadA [Flavipsychrobacter stenotrophus]
MAKTKTAFFCQQCGYETPKWTGKCPSCSGWNTFVEEVVQREDKGKAATPWDDEKKENNKAHRLDDIVQINVPRMIAPDPELNRVLGGGLVPGSVTLVAGEPGIGKSTLFLQVGILWNDITTLYVSGEESAQQIKLRAERIGAKNNNLFLLTATDTATIFNEVKKVKPDMLIIDSIQTLESPYVESAAGSVSQVRECAAELQRFAKTSGIPVFIIGHITKEGSIAGPKVLEHIVDTVLQFEGDRHYAYRILRTLKNRFGPTSELGIYEMVAQGMRPVINPSEILLSQHEEPLSGIAIASTMEGLRPMMIEVQALVTQAVYGNPQRTVSGLDPRRLQLLLAVLEKRGGFHFGQKDVFVNIAGGLKIEDPSIELALVCALLSSYEDKALPKNICLVGEIGLSGEIRAINRIDQRIAEADKLGMDVIFIPKANMKGLDLKNFKIEIKTVNKVEDVYKMLF